MSTTTRLGLQVLEDATAHAVTLINANNVVLDNAALVTIANTFTAAQYLTQSPTASVQFGNLNVGNGGFTGGAGHYSGGAGGSLIAVNLAFGGTADLLNLQINGVSKWKLGSGGNVTLGEGSNLVLGTATGSQLGTSSSQKIGAHGATPVAQIAGTTDLVAGLVTQGWRATSGAVPCNLNGGQLTAGIGAFSGGLKGSGSSLQWSRLAFTFAADADEALSVTTKENVELDIQAGVISTTRTLDVVAPNVGGFWIVINRNANPVIVKIGANTGITVGATRSRILTAPGGTNMFSLTQDNNYTL